MARNGITLEEALTEALQSVSKLGRVMRAAGINRAERRRIMELVKKSAFAEEVQ